MKRTPALIVFLVLALSSIVTGVKSFHTTRTAIAQDLTQALRQTALGNPDDWLSTDTIHQFRNHIHLAELRSHAYLSLSACEQQSPKGRQFGSLASDSLLVMPGVMAQGYVLCSAFSVLKRSDQRLSFLLALLAMFFLAHAMRRVEHRMVPAQPLTPMQARFMQLLQEAPNHELSKQEICNALWPGKPDASETLYTLVRRLRANTSVHIRNIRGRAYRLDYEE